MIDVVTVEKTNAAAASFLIETLQRLDISGTLFLGHPLVESVDSKIKFDATLASNEHGIVVFDFGDNQIESAEELEDYQNALYHAMHGLLYAFRPLVRGRQLAVPIHVLTLTDRVYSNRDYQDVNIVSAKDLEDYIYDLEGMEERYLPIVKSALQNTTSIKPLKKRSDVRREGSRGSILKELEKTITSFDQWQNRAALETPDGPQRIRGLAGSGKTVVLANKAARLHFHNPDWNIAITFNTRSLYQQFKDLVRRFYYLQGKEEPNWSRLHIRHAWGGSKNPGIYSEAATREGMAVRDFGYASSHFGRERAFEGACSELLEQMSNEKFKPIYDIFLIDEAQDLPHSFFEIAYHITKDPKRVVWAYDELQSLADYTMSPPIDLFGIDPSGNARVELINEPNSPAQDMILPVCYRNTPWALTIAHGLGFGTNRKGGLVQFFEDPTLWDAIGYEVVEGSLNPGDKVTLNRKKDAYPGQFLKYLRTEDVIQTRVFSDAAAQAEWVAQSVHNNLTVDELEIEDIMIIISNPQNIKSEGSRIMNELSKYNLKGHIAGVTGSVDEFFSENSVVISGIQRAKGNEAPMVYLLHSEYGDGALELIRRRNTLFTGITRSRAWVRVCGVGDGMKEIHREIEEITSGGFKLCFHVPTTDQLENMRKINRDRSNKEIRRLENYIEKTQQFVEAIDNGDLSVEALPVEIRQRLLEALRKSQEDE